MNSLQKKREEKILHYQQTITKHHYENDEVQLLSQFQISPKFSTQGKSQSKNSKQKSKESSNSDKTKLSQKKKSGSSNNSFNSYQASNSISHDVNTNLPVTHKLLGHGHQAKVYSAFQKGDENSEPICVKVFEAFKDKEQLLNAETEFKIAQALKGQPNIVQMKSFNRDSKITIDGQDQIRDFMQMEICPNGDLYDFISLYNEQCSKNIGLQKNDLELLRAFYLQLINALSLLHEKAGYAHMDLKLENVLISDTGILKLCDFGFSISTSSLVAKKLGTPAYMAPEVHNARLAPCKGITADIFSLGVIFFILAFGAPPFHSADKSDTFFRYLLIKPGSTDFFKFHPHTRAQFRAGLISQSLMDLITSMLSADPKTRIQEANLLKNHHFITQSAVNDQIKIRERVCNILKK